MAEAGYRVTGRVQGVGFRWWTRSLATRLGVTGTVRNMPDGAVVVHARGSDEQLASFHVELGKGPFGSRVTAVEPLPFSADGFADGEFVIVR
ncbi:acylphosphatase [Longimicrobium terrae]|uniref:acylphosphatase n=1 Tax=Longimicrobium terrae TaxID=1639882 RepID=A0A841GZX3_9BACT|nr:acylphosphatase [Longimicrobium terrae]MBB4636737.1 acylphosphatase [Longimicrobium terrae]MBB6071264.1 acylphosphatase [Longimicrobium terrae]NNC29310.1 acylphosphatase [Longimicrobium terrae]